MTTTSERMAQKIRGALTSMPIVHDVQLSNDGGSVQFASGNGADRLEFVAHRQYSDGGGVWWISRGRVVALDEVERVAAVLRAVNCMFRAAGI